VALGASALGLAALDAVAAGLPPEEKPKLCDAACESELENVGSVSVSVLCRSWIMLLSFSVELVK
jgi:hypothetical protein